MGRTESNRKGDEMDYRMSIDEAVESRHAVRRFTEEPISAEERAGIRDRSDPRAWYRAVASAGGTEHLLVPTNSREQILAATTRIFDAEVDRSRPVHRLGLTATGVLPEDAPGVQDSLFSTPEADARERRRQEAISAVKRKFGKNSLLKGVDLLPEATTRERNLQIGGHRSGE